MTMSDPVSRRIYRKRCIRSTTYFVLIASAFGVGGSNGAISGSIIFKMAADGHLGITVSRVTLASAGLSCTAVVTLLQHVGYE